VPVSKKPRVQLFLDLPDVTKHAESTFETLLECSYLTKSLGNSGQNEVMTCDCKPSVKNGINHACGDDSDCINRLTSIECINDRCGCGDDCQNQRFQKRQYARVDVINTEKKGYGLRALEDIPQGTFVYEYIGDVITEAKFHQRAKYYQENGYRHFYFMMLQKGEFIDATEKGCLARFCNHSCNPNSYVDKWVVGHKLRMGIFTKRDVAAGEEITFDYNVDRYGSEAQPCYCGEPNCIGVLGGKTQTEAVSRLPQILIEALELTGADEAQWAKQQRKRKKKTPEDLDEDYSDGLPVKPMSETSVSKVMSSLIQSREKWLVTKLLTRIGSTSDNAIHARVMQMHGYQIFSTLLRDWKEDNDIVLTILRILAKWPKLTKNKISSSTIESTVQNLANESSDPEIKDIAQSLLTDWSSLKMAYRIPRRVRPSEEGSSSPQELEKREYDSVAQKPTSIAAAAAAITNGKIVKQRQPVDSAPSGPAKRKYPTNYNQATASNSHNNSHSNTNDRNNNNNSFFRRSPQGTQDDPPLPPDWEVAIDPKNKLPYYYNRVLNVTQWNRPSNPPGESYSGGSASGPFNEAKSVAAKRAVMFIDPVSVQRSLQEQNIRKIIDAANRSAEDLQQRQQQQQQDQNEAAADEKDADRQSKPDEEKQLTKIFAKYVPNVVARYESTIGHKNVKQYSKEVCLFAFC
jgi:histone-lysine N-methyltransferase SETD2